jgi:hypothetical protein
LIDRLDGRLAGDTMLILGGGGMVGVQVALEAARELKPKRIVIAAVREAEVTEALQFLREQIRDVELIGEWGNIFVPEELKSVDRKALVEDRANFDKIFDAVFRRNVSYETSALYQLITKYEPSVVVDTINTATAISYQNEFELAIQTKEHVDGFIDRTGSIPREELEPLFVTIRKLLIAQGIPQIARHILLLHETLKATNVKVYVKVGTTGTGGMGLNIPYTHSEDKPSLTLLAKSAIGFAHTGLLFLLARTPSGIAETQGAIVKEVKPGAMIGFRRVKKDHITVAGEESKAFLVEAHEEALGDQLRLRDDSHYARFEDRDVPLEIIGADTGENGFFSIGEFQAITFPRQMEYVTPEEVARTVVLEIIGASTGRDVLAAIDGAITEPSYRAGVLRDHAVREMRQLERQISGEVPSIAVGKLGPPRLSKFLAEAYLIQQASLPIDSIDQMAAIDAAEMQRRVESYLAANPIVAASIVRIGTPILRERDGRLTITRGPRINIPPVVAGRTVVDISAADADQYANAGWVDLRLSNFARWRERLADAKPGNIEKFGSAAFDPRSYPAERFDPGDFVGWLFVNEPDELGMIGRRLY